jgi:hypothetical protein
MEQATLDKAGLEDDLVYRWRFNEALAARYSRGAGGQNRR